MIKGETSLSRSSCLSLRPALFLHGKRIPAKGANAASGECLVRLWYSKNMKQRIIVTGMTCQNCVRHVREAVSSLPGVRSADVDLDSGAVDLETEREVPRDELTSALDEAGYSLA